MAKSISTPPSPESDDEGTNQGGAPEGTKDQNDNAGDDDKVTLTKAELDELRRRRDGANKKARQVDEELERERAERQKIADDLKAHKAKLKEFEDERRKREEESAVKSGDFEKARKSYDAREAELKAMLDEREKDYAAKLADADKRATDWETKYRKNFFETKVYDVLEKISDIPKSAYLHVKEWDCLEMIEEEGGVKIEVKDSTQDPETYLKRRFEEEGLQRFLRNPRKEGSGAAPAVPNGSGGSAGTTLPTGFDKLDKADQRKWFAQHKDYKLKA